MPESRLFMSSLSRRQLARRRLSRSPAWSLRPMMIVLMVLLICAAAFIVGRGGM
jgi:hypothetical protein